MNKIFRILLSSIALLSLLFVSSSLHNSAPSAYAQACTVPTQVQSVSITFPSCVGNVCNFTQGSCTWGIVSGATANQVTITEVETGTSVLSQQFAASVTTTAFPVKESNTYRCDVSAINACGTGTAGTNSLLCKVDAAVTITPVPAATAIPVQPLVVPKSLPVTGNNYPAFFILLGSGMVILTGIGLMIF